MLIPNIKYSVNVAFNRHFGNLEMPEPLEFDLGLKLFPKSLRVALGRLRSEEKRLRSSSLFLINTLFQGWKKGLLPLDIPAFDKNMSKHKQALCNTPGDCSDDVLDDVFRISSELLRKFSFRKRESSVKLPSTSATIQYQRKEGGSFSSLLDIWYGDRLNRSLDSRCLTFLGFVSNKTEVKEINGYGPTCFELKEIEKENWLTSLRDPYEVLPYGVLEPLKIRTITRPSFRTHWGLRGMQSQLLNYLNRFASFSITGDSNKENLDHHIQRVVENPRFSHLVSGDFSAATDTLKGSVTSVIWEVIGTRGVPWWIFVKGRESLLRTKIHYDQRCMPKIDKNSPYRNFVPSRDMEEGLQSTGQLMGNILSFPILCIANYCAYHRAIEKLLGYNLAVKTLMEEFPVAINGDDILFRSDECLYVVWKETTREIGFNLSLGKNFYHSDFCQINSQLFRVRRDIFGSPVGVDLISYFNFGQLTGRKKGMSSDDSTATYFGSVKSASVKSDTFQEKVLELKSLKRNFDDCYLTSPEKLRPIISDLQKYWFDRRFGSIVGPFRYLAAFPREIGGLGFTYETETREKKKFDSLDFFRSLFSCKTPFGDASYYYPSLFSLSRLTPDYQISRIRPRIPLLSPIRGPKADWVKDQVLHSEFSLVL